MDADLQNKRNPNESRAEYHNRLKRVRTAVKAHLAGQYICRHVNKKGHNKPYRRPAEDFNGV
jgi:hypothetical protein